MSRIGRTLAVALTGLDGHIVDVEVLTQSGLPAFVLVGLPDTAVGESRDRVRAALASSGFGFPNCRVTVNLSPAYLPKTGTGFDLGIAVAALIAMGQIDQEAQAGTVYLGELSLDGRIRTMRGILPTVAGAVAAGRRRVVVPNDAALEARLVKGAEVLAVESLDELAWRLGADIARPDAVRLTSGQHHGGAGEAVVAVAGPGAALPSPGRLGTGPMSGAGVDASSTTDATHPDGAVQQRACPDLAEVVGQAQARYALEVAAAGGHHLMLQGPPGNGKTMLASRLPGILPPLTEQESVEVTALHSIAGALDARGGLIRRPPFQDPHHTATPAAMVGGGSGAPRPGAISLAHRGVLFLDECPEFSPRVLQTLRQPLERGEIVIHRANATARYPARFHLVLAANPCPCGQGYGRAQACTCSSLVRRRYLGRLSGPLIDRIDLWVDVEPVGPLTSAAALAGEPSAAVAARVAAARQAQATRYRALGWRLNSEAPGGWLRQRAGFRCLDQSGLNRALETGALSLRGMDRVLRVAWTMADLDGRDGPGAADIDAAMVLRRRGT
ncbi:MAG: YifB family Mg chelatase-like AAA ATPase [Bifidobacteriaceae bacterium]|jgi:magnesium chelatase family protein|nr:YifB family Mg chelatase-like AAA ATPase [Bifidobacteriaceae bacterium]